MDLIFIPGLLCTPEVWGDLNNLRRSHNCIDVELNKFNSISLYTNYLEEKIDHGKSYAVIGISMGGYIAIDIAVRNLPEIKKIILISTTASSVDNTSIADREKAIEYAMQDDMQFILKQSASLCFYKKKSTHLELEKRMAYTVGCESYIKQQQAIINRKSNINNLSNIEADTMIISSKDDIVIPFSDSLTLFNEIKTSQLHLFSLVGHLPTLENANITFNLVKNFLGN